MASQGLISTGGSFDLSTKVKKTKDGIFGMELEELLAAVPNRPIPLILDQCVTYLRQCGMKTPGIFRVSPNNAELNAVRKLYKTPIDVVDLKKKATSPHTVAGLLKSWLLSLPEPLFGFELYDLLLELFTKVPEESRLSHATVLLNQYLSTSRRIIFSFLFEFLYDLSQFAEVNKMSPNNLGIVFGPNLIRPREHTQSTMLDQTNVEVVEFFVTHFPEVQV